MAVKKTKKATKKTAAKKKTKASTAKKEQATGRAKAKATGRTTNDKRRKAAEKAGVPPPPPLPTNPACGLPLDAIAQRQEQQQAEIEAELDRRQKAVKGYKKRLIDEGLWSEEDNEKAQETKMVAVARDMTGAMLLTLFEVATDLYATSGARTRAANSVLDRGYGRARQKVEMEAGEGLRGLSADGLRIKMLDTMQEFAKARGIPLSFEEQTHKEKLNGSNNGRPKE